MKTIIALLLFCILFVLCWPLALVLFFLFLFAFSVFTAINFIKNAIKNLPTNGKPMKKNVQRLNVHNGGRVIIITDY